MKRINLRPIHVYRATPVHNKDRAVAGEVQMDEPHGPTLGTTFSGGPIANRCDGSFGNV